MIAGAAFVRNKRKTRGETSIWKGRDMARKLSGIGAIVVLSVLSALLLRGCGDPAIQPPAAGAKAELDLSELIVCEIHDPNAPAGTFLENRIDRKMVRAFFDRTGRRVEGPDLGYVLCTFHEGLAAAYHDDKKHLHGYVDSAGRVVIPFQYYYSFEFSDGRAVAAVNDSNDFEKRRAGLIDRHGRWIVPPKYKDVRSGSDGRWAFRIHTNDANEERWGFLDADGRVVIEPKYKLVGDYSEGLCLASDGNDAMFLDKQGRTAFRLPKDARHAEGFSCGLALVYGGSGVWGNIKEGGMLFDDPNAADPWAGFLAHDGTMAIKPAYTAAGSFTEGLAPVSMTKDAQFTSTELETNAEPFYARGGWWGFIDTTGKLVIEMKFDVVSQFSESLARVRQNGKWGFIDKKGEFVIPPRYEWVRSFKNGIAEAVLDGMIILIDRQGKTIVNTGVEYVLF
jgi:hypothetical protein